MKKRKQGVLDQYSNVKKEKKNLFFFFSFIFLIKQYSSPTFLLTHVNIRKKQLVIISLIYAVKPAVIYLMNIIIDIQKTFHFYFFHQNFYHINRFFLPQKLFV